MAVEIRIYFEGHKLLEAGFSVFFRELREQAKEKRCRFRLISSKSGEEARRDFGIAIRMHSSARNILLIDSEGPRPPHQDRVFWMVETMEAWFHADPSALADFYGSGFQASALKANPNVEKIPKKDLEDGLAKATRKGLKRNYYDHKTSHGSKLLGLIDPLLVRKAAPECDRLFTRLFAYLN